MIGSGASTTSYTVTVVNELIDRRPLVPGVAYSFRIRALAGVRHGISSDVVAAATHSRWRVQSNGVRVLTQEVLGYEGYRLDCAGAQSDAGVLRCEAWADRVWSVQVQAKNPNRNPAANECGEAGSANNGHWLDPVAAGGGSLPAQRVCLTQGHTWVGESKVPDGRIEAYNSQSGLYYGAGSTQFALAVAGDDVGGLGVEPLAATAQEEFNDGVAELTKRFGVYVARVCFEGNSSAPWSEVQWVRGFFKQFSIPEVAHLEWCVDNPNSSEVPQTSAETDLREWARIVARNSEIVTSEEAVPASLIADVRSYAAETENGQAHVNRWKQVLLAFGEQVPGFTGTPMTAAQAQQNAQTFWKVRWDPVADTLEALEAQPVSETSTEETSNNPSQKPAQKKPAITRPRRHRRICRRFISPMVSTMRATSTATTCSTSL